MYTLTLSEQELETIAWVGYRYSWSEALSSMEEGDNTIPEHEAWEIVSAFEADTEGGHSYFPCLDHTSELARKLFHFMESVV